MERFNFDKKQFLIVMLSIVFGLVMGYFFFRPTKQPLPYDQELIDKQMNELKEKNKMLQGYVLFVEKKSFELKCRVDSLEALKPKIETKYVSKFKEIDDASAIGVVNEFQSILSKSGVR